MKTDREQLKEIVKECLLEILAEGLGKKTKSRDLQESPSRGNLSRDNAREIREERLRAENERLAAHRKSLDEKKIERNPAINAFRGNSVMQEILADTAKTTLVEQMAHEKRGTPVSSDRASKAVADADDITDLFGDTASVWETLAFSSKK